jgi:hypothetical protein
MSNDSSVRPAERRLESVTFLLNALGNLGNIETVPALISNPVFDCRTESSPQPIGVWDASADRKNRPQKHSRLKAVGGGVAWMVLNATHPGVSQGAFLGLFQGYHSPRKRLREKQSFKAAIQSIESHA